MATSNHGLPGSFHISTAIFLKIMEIISVIYEQCVFIQIHLESNKN